ncbi:MULTISPECIES: ribosome maturation factor RimP [Methylocaldum]|jgi:ribosome maturation factor RimP|uniref:ribosome maturation factor RimP n=1 Tax=unclassified Methylocaldum TaxID=2622260 RepID=UPI00098B917D|nr:MULTISPECIES: ribosome maturation factor RimP [unclassified Methylocaldum]MBP1151036.1 ribosome maturation factor RimP [Methylocaldum sp. RMAD-M]MVF21701.1 ribosome maturation factor RimP [Methylocaldum sp. BRCS4]
MKPQERLAGLIEPVVSGLGYELIDIEFDAHRRVLRVYIDSESGITLDDCTRVSYQLSGVLDVEDPIPGRYQLEISSPGLDRPLSKLEHFVRFKGSLARLQLARPIDGRRKFKAYLAGVEGDYVLIQEGGETLRIPFESIEKARLAPEFGS